MNIISDKNELKVLIDGLQSLPLKFSFTQTASDELKPLERNMTAEKKRTTIPFAQEKIKSRKENRIGLKINLNSLIKTQQGLNRILMILSIYASGQIY